MSNINGGNGSSNKFDGVLDQLEQQIPAPMGVETSRRMIMGKRKLNLRRGVVPDDIRADILNRIAKINELTDDFANISEIAQIIRYPRELLLDRGENYFAEMENRVQAYLVAMGDQDLKKELIKTTDRPQILVKQYGKAAVNLVADKQLDTSPDPISIFSVILALKSSELMFDDATTSPDRRVQITKSLLSDYFSSQMEILKIIGKHHQKDSSQEELVETPSTECNTPEGGLGSD